MSSINLDYEASASTIPAPNVIVKHSMPNFIVIGKSGAGKTSLATRLAAELGCKFVSAATLSEIYMDDETNEVSCLLVLLKDWKSLDEWSRSTYQKVP
jgi:ATP-dependent protease Clp ATPase subunit